MLYYVIRPVEHVNAGKCKRSAFMVYANDFFGESDADILNSAIENALYFRAEAKKIENLAVLEQNVDFDITKIFIKMKGLTGLQLEYVLEHDYKIEVESASDAGLLILSNIDLLNSFLSPSILISTSLSSPKYFKISFGCWQAST